MTIVIIGNDAALAEAKGKLGDMHRYVHGLVMTGELVSSPVDVVFDFNTQWDVGTATVYRRITAPVFLNTIFTTLSLTREKVKTGGSVFGFCGLPTFFNRSLMEVTTSSESDQKLLKEVSVSLGIQYTEVKDLVGMVTPRVIGMIINEAYEALQQGVASKEDIDLSMKLGTNYPFGPFEWGERIGLTDLRNLMLALKTSASDSRFNPNF